jgi:hypothetical protein
MMTVPTIESVREQAREAHESGANARVHPNGFIQLDLIPVGGWDESKQRGHSGASLRLHIWNPPGIELVRQNTKNEIHDHVFDMRSTVLKGRLMQSLYEFIPQLPDDITMPTHEKYRAVYDKKSSSRLQGTGEYGWLDPVRWGWVEAGQTYFQPAFTLHDSTPEGLVVTYMEKIAIHDGDATVICEYGKTPDNDFDRAKAMDPDVLWAAIERSLS